MPSAVRRLSREEALTTLAGRDSPHAAGYLSMYSSWYGGIVTDPWLMMVPVDDHIVHRGDGVFEAIKCSGGSVYALDRHLARLRTSAELVHMPMPCAPGEMAGIVIETIRAAKTEDALIRLYVSRGPGGFTANPYECVGSQLYVVVTALKHPAPETYERGVTLKTSAVPVKEGCFANVKSCNYLHNVLMKKEAVDAGVDFTVSLDGNGRLAEGSTENFFVLSRENELLAPRFERTLRGVTLTRLMELARPLVGAGALKRIAHEDLGPEDAYGAREAYVSSTTMDILPVVRYDGRAIGDGRPGPMFKTLLELVRRDVESGAGVRTPIR